MSEYKVGDGTRMRKGDEIRMRKLTKLYNVEIGIEPAKDEIYRSRYIPTIKKYLKQEDGHSFTSISDAYNWLKKHVKQGAIKTYGLMWTSIQDLRESDIDEIELNGVFDEMDTYFDQPIVLFVQKTDIDDALVIV